VAGAVAGGLIFQSIFGFTFSMAVAVGYIACVGMATQTGIVMLVYLHDSIRTHGGLAAIKTSAELTRAIIDGLVVGVGRERFIVPLFAVREMFRPDREMLSTVHGRDDMALVRGHLLPVLRLARRLGVKPRSEDPCEGVFIVTENEGRSFCLLVDEFLGKQEVVIKSLGESLKHVPGIAGAAILGDGRVGLVLDIEGIFDQRTHA
jgi:two-component system chemotaxis sensor kinase CheA